MLCVDTVITKEYWEPIFERIVRNFGRKEFYCVHGDVYWMKMGEAEMYVAATKDEDGCFLVYGWYYMRRRRGWMAWQVDQSYIFKDHRMQGWSNKILDAMIMHEGIIVASGPQQTHLAQAFWRRLIASEKYTIWAHDFKNLESFAPVAYDPDNDCLDCTLPVYDIDSTSPKCDVRLIAIRKLNDSRLRSSNQSAVRPSVPRPVRQTVLSS